MTSHPNHLLPLDNMHQINTLTDARRLEILRYLMVKPSTVSQIGRQMEMYPAAVRYHIKKLESANLVELCEVRESPAFTEKYYAARAGALLIQQTILPYTDRKSIIFMGSHDLAWEELTTQFGDIYPQTKFLNFPIGSLDGLIALRQGNCQLAGCHLLDSETQQYNIPYVKHLFPGKSTQLVRLANRVQGLLVAGGNPKNIRGLEDLPRTDLRFINRNAGSGTRIWLDKKLAELGIPPDSINGYTKEVNSHTAVAQEIHLGNADLGVGLIAAGENQNLDSIPIFEEKYDLVFPTEKLDDPELSSVIDLITSQLSRRTIHNLPGYDSRQTGVCLEV